MKKYSEGKKRRLKSKVLLIIILEAACVLCGCDVQGNHEQTLQVRIEEYQKDAYQTVKVRSGALTPVLRLELTPYQYEVKSYSVDQERLTVSKMDIEEGSHVKAGQVMVTFQNKELQSEIAEYQKRREEDEMLVTHYERLQKIDSKQNYEKDIKKLKADILIANLYLAETRERMAAYQLVAEREGTVIRVSDKLLRGYADRGEVLVQVASGSSNYVATTSADYSLQEGDIYKAKWNMASYKMKVVDISKKKKKQQIIFQPVSNMAGVTETDRLEMEITEKAIKNALYVEQDAITSVRNRKYIFRIDGKGYRQAVPVKVKRIIDGYAVISGAVKEGEQVTID